MEDVIYKVMEKRTAVANLRTPLEDKIYNLLHENGIKAKKSILSDGDNLETVLNFKVDKPSKSKLEKYINEIRLLDNELKDYTEKVFSNTAENLEFDSVANFQDTLHSITRDMLLG